MRHLDGEARDRLIIWIKRRMEEYGITLDALVESIEQDKPRPLPPKYRDAMGNEWDGVGEKPDWIRRALNAGQTLDFYLIQPMERSDA